MALALEVGDAAASIRPCVSAIWQSFSSNVIAWLVSNYQPGFYFEGKTSRPILQTWKTLKFRWNICTSKFMSARSMELRGGFRGLH
jgi:hypothetical protein